MAQTLKILGQSAPGATTETALYTTPASTTTAVSSLMVANRGGTATTFRVSVSAGGGATATKDYIYYDVPISAADTFAATLGITLGATDTVRIYAGNANLSFSLFGVENS